MTERLRPELDAFLRKRFPGSRIDRVAGDASTRSFHRARLADGSTRVVMDYGAPFRGETDDVRLSRIFRAASLPVAEILSVEPEAGCLVLEDLGDRTLETSLRESSGRERARWTERAVDLAVRIAVDGTRALARSERADGPALDAERFRFEMDFFVEHYALGLARLPSAGEALAASLHELAALAASGPRVLCHRDFHSRNLMVRDDGTLAMVDIQDARWGPDTYDLASVLCDAYADIDDGVAERMIDRYRLSLPEPPPADAFRKRYQVVAVQRMIKALGTFGYQVTVLNRRRYLEGVPRTLVRLRALVPSLAGIGRLGDALEPLLRAGAPGSG